MTSEVDSGERTLHTTSSNECKFLWNSNSRRKTIAEKTSLTITSSFRESLNWKASPSSCFWVSFVGCLQQCSVLFIKTTYSREPRHCGVQREERIAHAFAWFRKWLHQNNAPCLINLFNVKYGLNTNSITPVFQQHSAWRKSVKVIAKTPELWQWRI